MSLEVVGNKQIGGSVHKLLIVADLVCVKVENKTESKGGVSQHGKQATLITKDGVVLPTSVAIRYLARMRPDLCLYGQTFLEMALVDKALRHTEYHILIPLETLSALSNKNAAVTRKAKEDIICALEDCIEPQLLSSTFLIGDRLTVADIDLALSLCDAIHQNALSISCLQSTYPSTMRWLDLVMHQSAVMAYYDFQTLCAKSKSNFDETDVNAAQGAAAGKSERKKKEQQGEKKQPEKNVSSAAATTQEIEAQIEQEESKKKKKTNPLDELPSSNFVLDVWKREYSNSKQLRDVAMPSFWKKFDPEGWCLWHIRYDKIEGENTKGYTTANMLGGFLQRIEPSFRQYSFGVNNVLGSEGNFDIEAVWLIRGQELPLELTEHPSFEYYTFTKLNPQNDLKHKQLVEDFWCNDEVVEGRHIDSCKVWK